MSIANYPADITSRSLNPDVLSDNREPLRLISY